MPPPEICPNCGATVPPQAKACPSCGSCESTGWSNEAASDGLGLPDEEFDYDDFAKREFGGEDRAPRRISPFWWLIAVFAAILLLILVLK